MFIAVKAECGKKMKCTRKPGREEGAKQIHKGQSLLMEPIATDSAGLHMTSNATIENPDLLVKGAELQAGDWLASPGHTRDDQGDTAARESIHTVIGKDPIKRDPLLQITDWDSQTLLSQDEDSFKRSRYRIGGSADSVLSLTSSQSLLPLEWKTLRSSQSQGTLAHFSDVTLEITDGGHKPPLDSNQDVVDDIIEDEVTFKVCAHTFNHNLGTNYSVDSRTNHPIALPGSPSPKDTNYPQQFSNAAQYMPVLCPRTEKLSEFGIQVKQAHISGTDQDSHLIDELWTAVASPKSLYNTNISSTGCGSNSNNHEPVRSPVLPQSLLKSPNEQREEFNQPMKKVQTEIQPLLQEKDVCNQQWSVPSLPTFECSSPVILQQRIVNLKSQISGLQEANETAVLELAKADEEISQLKHEMAQLKSDYLQKLADSKEENLILKKKINRIYNSHGPVETYEQALHDEICQLRNESRSLREISHQLNEENHRLKEELWDSKRQYEWLMHTVAGKQDERLQERSRNDASPSSTNSESTEILVAGYYDTGLAKENRDLRDDASEHTKAKHSRSHLSCINQHNQTSHENSEQLLSCSASNNLSGIDICSKYSPIKAPMLKTALSRRPFAPRSVADLKIGNLVKFSRPTGKISKGIVKYLGPLLGREEDYLGIELEGNQEGRHDGTFQGTRYFLCAPNKGVFVNFSKVIVAWE